MKTTRLLALVLLLIAALSAMTVHAQESVEYGDIVEGEMTEDEFEFEYTFEGEEGDVVIILFKPVEEYADLTDPIMMLEFDGDTIADTTDAFVFGGPLTMAAQLEDSGEHTLFVTRTDEEDGESVGEFTIEFILAEPLEVESPLSGETDSDGRPAYYAVTSDDDWGISYIKEGGDMEVEVSVNQVDDFASGLTSIATASGSALTEAAFGIFEGGETYIVVVGEPLFAFNFDTVSAEFTVELLTFE